MSQETRTINLFSDDEDAHDEGTLGSLLPDVGVGVIRWLGPAQAIPAAAALPTPGKLPPKGIDLDPMAQRPYHGPAHVAPETTALHRVKVVLGRNILFDQMLPHANVKTVYDYVKSAADFVRTTGKSTTLNLGVGSAVLKPGNFLQVCTDGNCTTFSTYHLVKPGPVPPGGVGATAIEIDELRRKLNIPQFSRPTVRWLGQKSTLGFGLGALPYPVNIYFPELAPDWDQMTQEMKNQVTAEAKKQEQIYQNAIAALKKEPGACDATVPGKLAGQLKEYLIEAGGDPALMSKDDNVFGDQEMSEWLRVFGGPPTQADAAAAVGTTWFGKRPISLAVICGKSIKLPKPSTTAPPPPPPPEPPEPPPLTTTTKAKKSDKSWLLLAAGAAGALFLLLKPPPIPPRASERS